MRADRSLTGWEWGVVVLLEVGYVGLIWGLVWLRVHWVDRTEGVERVVEFLRWAF